MGRFASLLVGGAVGAVAAFLFSPRNGAENRAVLSEKLSEQAAKLPSGVKDQANSALSALASGSTVAINTVVDNGSDALKVVKGKVKPVPAAVEQAAAPVLSEADDLREKIDAARERIATQVAKNAEAVQDAAVDRVPGLVDAALEAKAQAGAHASTAQEAISDTAAALKERIIGSAKESADAAAEAAEDASDKE